MVNDRGRVGRAVEFWHPALDVLQVRIKFLSLEVWVENAEVRRCIAA